MRASASTAGFVLALFLALFASAALGDSASADVLCAAELVSGPKGETCQEPYASGEKFEASAKEVLLSGSSFEIHCSSTITLVSGESLGEKKGLAGKITALTFSGCKGSCSSASAANLPFKATLNATEKGDGTLAVTALEKEPTVNVEGCPLGLKCSYGWESMTLGFNGGEPAIIEASKEPVKRTVGTFCPKEGMLTGNYELQQPPGGRAQAAIGPTPATVLCKVQADLCNVNDRYGATVAFEAEITGAGVLFKWNGSVENTCPISVIKGTTNTIAAPMLATITDWKLEACGPCEEAKAVRLPWKAEIKAAMGTGGGGVLTMSSGGTGDPVLEMLGCSGGINCNFRRTYLVTSVKGGAPAKLEAGSLFLFELSGGCGTMEIASGSFKFTLPTTGVWVAHV